MFPTYPDNATPSARLPNLDGATILITGGAGFVGGALALELKRASPGANVIALDNLRRAGSELRRTMLARNGVDFVHGDIRCEADLALGNRPVDWLIECSAEPSVMAGFDGSPRYVIDTNLTGTINCLELARTRRSRVVFLSTSRIYPVGMCNHLAFVEEPTRFRLTAQTLPGASEAGISEQFPLTGVRTLYGATKFASEILLEEYAAIYGLEHATIRFGVISGPGQMGKVDQGVFALWMARHLWAETLTYKGWGGTGKQVRDALHIEDARDLVWRVMERWTSARGRTFNAGGGNAVSASLLETTAACERLTGRTLKIASAPETHPSDVRIYVTDHRAVSAALDWSPSRGIERILADMQQWMLADERRLRPILIG
jgi:CDP-paratose 2-epimerase